MSVFQSWRTAIPVPAVLRGYPPNPLYVDTVNGTPAGTGSIDKPVNNLSLALELCSGLADYEIRIRAPESNPLRQEVIFNTSKDVVLSGVDDEPWHIYGSEIHDSGWGG
ncbi:hypothetical protein ACRFHX_28580, partial [Klebsiella pneumoniae]